jgi:hypothetical protein
MSTQVTPFPGAPPVDNVLADALAALARELPRLLAEGHEGRHALVQGGRVEGVWDTFADAVEAGYDRFGLDRFLVERIADPDRPAPIPRVRG